MQQLDCYDGVAAGPRSGLGDLPVPAPVSFWVGVVPLTYKVKNKKVGTHFLLVIAKLEVGCNNVLLPFKCKNAEGSAGLLNTKGCWGGTGKSP